MVKASEKEFLFGTRKPFFLGMCQFCFLSEASWETVTFAFIYFIFILLSSSLPYKFTDQDHVTMNHQGFWILLLFQMYLNIVAPRLKEILLCVGRQFFLRMILSIFGVIFYWAIGLMSRVFANGPGDWGSIPGRVIPKTQEMVLDVFLLNAQHYKI